MFPRLMILIFACCYAPSPAGVLGQECVTYKLVPRVTYESRPLTISQYVDETVLETKQLTTYKPVWTRETRHRTTSVLKPVTKTSQRVERFLVRRPVVETSYVEKQLQETSYESVTEMKEQRWLVEKPIVETEYRDQQYLVKKPVTKTYLQAENVTRLKPVTIREKQCVEGATLSSEFVFETGRNRLRWLRPGTYVDPATGQIGFKRAGLHWVPDQQLALRSKVAPAVFEQEVERTIFTPERIQVQRPVQLTQYVDQIETRKVPVQVSKTSREILVTRTPVTVSKPVTSIKTQRVPVREVKYREEVLVRRVPITETSYQRVEQVEPYEVEVCKWVAETKEVKVPRVVRRRVDYSINQLVPKTDCLRVPLDSGSNIEYAPQLGNQTVYRYPVSDRIAAIPVAESPYSGSRTQNAISSLSDSEYEMWLRRNNLVRETQESIRLAKPTNDNQGTASSVLVPETRNETNVDNPSTDTVQITRRPTLSGPTDEVSDSNSTTQNEPTIDTPNDGPQLNDPGRPSVEDQNDSNLELESSESSDISRDDR